MPFLTATFYNMLRLITYLQEVEPLDIMSAYPRMHDFCLIFQLIGSVNI